MELGAHRAPRCEPVVSLVRSRRAPPVPLSPDRPSKILLVQVGTLSSSPIPRLGLSVFFLFFLSNLVVSCPEGTPAPTSSVEVQVSDTIVDL